MACYFYPLAYKFSTRTACVKSESVIERPIGTINRSVHTQPFSLPAGHTLMALWHKKLLFCHTCTGRYFAARFSHRMYFKITEHLIGTMFGTDKGKCRLSAVLYMWLLYYCNIFPETFSALLNYLKVNFMTAY